MESSAINTSRCRTSDGLDPNCAFGDRHDFACHHPASSLKAKFFIPSFPDQRADAERGASIPRGLGALSFLLLTCIAQCVMKRTNSFGEQSVGNDPRPGTEINRLLSRGVDYPPSGWPIVGVRPVQPAIRWRVLIPFLLLAAVIGAIAGFAKW
jgi:hypothetical protein